MLKLFLIHKRTWTNWKAHVCWLLPPRCNIHHKSYHKKKHKTGYQGQWWKSFWPPSTARITHHCPKSFPGSATTIPKSYNPGLFHQNDCGFWVYGGKGRDPLWLLQGGGRAQHVCMILHAMKSEYLPVERDAMALVLIGYSLVYNKPGWHNHYIIATPCIAQVGGLTR